MDCHINDTSKTATAPNHNLVGHRIDQGRLELVSVLGLGAYGVVYLARDLTSVDMAHPNLYAVKALNKIGLDARQKSFQRREIALHSLASPHPSIVTLHAVIESPSCVFVVLDYCPDGDLFGMITEKKKYLGKTDAIKAVFVQIVEAVEFCHCLGISHRDLKPENILCKNNGDAVVLADFGLATIERTSSDFGCGSTFYMSPECHGGMFERLSSYSTFQNDVWSLGVILVNLTCGRNPWKQAGPSDETFRAYLANPDFLRSILPISESCNLLLKRIFCPNPCNRISLEALKAEVLLIETFDMSPVELSRATRATREAARAWRKNVPASPNTEQPPPELLSCQCKVPGENPTRHVRSPRPIVSSFAHRKQTDSLQAFQQRQASPFNNNPLIVKSGFSSSIYFDQSTMSQLDKSCARDISPIEPLMTTSISASTSHSSVSLSKQPVKRRGILSSSLLKLSRAVTSSSKEPCEHQNSRKKNSKPTSIIRPNAPCPLLEIGATSDVSSTPRGSAHCSKGSKHSILNFLPFTPPPSASPSKATFGMTARRNRFFYPSSNSTQAFPLTPLTPDHHIGSVLPLSSSSPSALL